ncbi:hypothetical protein T11_16051 [Trichinella zimbabwensis]|uniref:Uncharacterized protein n=1 Tax=Trichinella zimbabwensis TaxID=268475 RepID=A0A0V1I174_9BILA|nr:hypothetical protein T11_16051 [Trichinella zimbabwensis]
MTPGHGGRAGTFVDVVASSGGPSPARAHGQCFLGFHGCSPVGLGLRAQAGSRSEHPAVIATLDRGWRSHASLPCSREHCCCTPACRSAACHPTAMGSHQPWCTACPEACG